MDLSETYVKMCEKADLIPTFEIKTIGYLVPGIVWQDGNCFYNQFSVSIPSNNTKLIWLPRQDQLQEMLQVSNLIEFFVIDEKFGSDYSILLSGYDDLVMRQRISQSGEKFWLATVMYLKHNKTWNGENWV